MSFNRQGALLNAVMLAAILAVVCGPIRRFMPGWQPSFLAGAGLLVALEASVVHHTFRRERMWLTETTHYLIPELAVMLVLMRIATTLSAGARTLQADAARWLYDPLSIFDMPFLAAILAGLVIGWLAHVAMEDMFVLAPREFEQPDPEDSARIGALLAEDRRAALRRVNRRFITGGVLLLICLSMEALNLEQLLGASQPLSSLSIVAALCYLIGGFLLYSQARLSLLQARWRLDGARVAPLVARRWTYTSWLIVVGVAALALLLPRSYGLGLLDTLRSALGVVGYAIAVIGYLLMWLIGVVLLVPAWLMAMLMQSPQSPPPPPLTPLSEGLPPPPAALHEPQLLPALIFWICIGLLSGYAGWIILQRHSWLRHALLSRGPLHWLRSWLGLLWGDARGLVRQAVELAQARLTRPAPPRPSEPWLRLRQLAPRELIRYFYRSTLRRAAARGLPRGAAQTPYEYGTTLSNYLPDAQDAITELTDSFVAAQYSPAPVAAADAKRTRNPWQRLRRQLRLLEPSKDHQAPGDRAG